MPANPPNPTPEQAAWGSFYVKLHALAERIRKENTADNLRPAQGTSPRRASQTVQAK